MNDSIIDEAPTDDSFTEKATLDADKLEEDLLKDLDDDQEDDLESVGREMEDLLESVLEDDVKEKEKKAENEVKAVVDDPAETDEDSTKVAEKSEETEKTAQESEKSIDDELEENLLKDDEPETAAEIPEVEKLEDKSAESEPVLEKAAEVQDKPDDVENKSDDVQEKPDEAAAENLPTPSTSDTTEIPAENPENPQRDATKSPEEDEDLLEACDSPRESRPTEVEGNQQDDMSETSSTPDETPEESSDEKVQNGSNDEEKNEVEPEKSDEAAANDDEKMDVDEVEVEAEKMDDEATTTANEKDEVNLCIVMDSDAEVQAESVDLDGTLSAEEPKEIVPLKLKFMRRFSTAVGKVSRPELEEMLVQKITESLMFCSENTELRARLEKQEKLCETFKKRLDNVVKQYNDLQMIHTRVMKDLKDRPDAPITPVKITRAVGLQVYQPVPRTKTATMPSPLFNIKPSVKRPIEVEAPVNGKSPENSGKRKKRITPLRPALTATERANLDAQEAKEEQKLRMNVGKNITPSPTVTMTAITNGGPKKSTPNYTSSQSIDLTDDLDEGSSTTVGKTPQPPALVAIRGNNQTTTTPQRAFVVKPVIVSANSPANRIVQYRSEFFTVFFFNFYGFVVLKSSF